ncbi:MAG: NAD(P)(+) transhydrogenase (Re/Si-specific) subunit beta, partial [Candidatus Dormibacteraeota bacterium]|nr:NAD(P)(+) transhydrogenase (Re/Si-specific) subunit beta [Candidatus Dormibacteraeota bacterium]
MTIATALVYLLAAVLFILGLRYLSSPRTARRGNLVAAAGMLIAIVWTLIVLRSSFTVAGVVICVVGVVLGAFIGTVGARLVQMTAVPQMVAAFNGVGGGAAALVATSELLSFAGAHPGVATTLPSVFAIVIGGISFAGSLIAFLKLQELMTGRPVIFPAQQAVMAGLAIVILALAVVVLFVSGSAAFFVPLLLVALAFGLAFVLPIGGADMPVVISLLNACTGLAVAASGFVLNNFALIVAGTLVGSSGTILTQLMSQAMGRSLPNLVFGAFQSHAAGPALAGAENRSVHPSSAEDIATMLAYARSVIIVPGYGLAVAQAQHVVRELATELEKRGVEVSYAIHPVAGRMPGHMNVLLAEANVPYEQLREMDLINGEFKNADVALVVGANDVVNPAARNSPGSPIYGMPILNVDEAHHIVFL